MFKKLIFFFTQSRTILKKFPSNILFCLIYLIYILPKSLVANMKYIFISAKNVYFRINFGIWDIFRFVRIWSNIFSNIVQKSSSKMHKMHTVPPLKLCQREMNISISVDRLLKNEKLTTPTCAFWRDELRLRNKAVLLLELPWSKQIGANIGHCSGHVLLFIRGCVLILATWLRRFFQFCTVGIIYLLTVQILMCQRLQRKRKLCFYQLLDG